MHPTNKPEAAVRGGLPDRDNPLAWRRLQRDGAAGARALLATLTDEEVRRYMAVAQDQVAIEERFSGLKIASAATSGALTGWCLLEGLIGGFRGWVVAGLGLGLVMGYWPWRVYQCRRMWLKHREAARSELVRRNVPV